MKVSLPGIGGSLGECCVCGESFAMEILTGKGVPMVSIGGFSRDLPVHKKCVGTLEEVQKSGGDWKLLPNGPLRREFAQFHQSAPTEASELFPVAESETK